MARIFSGLCSILLTFLLSSCQTIDPYTGEQQTAKATQGALIGAAAGAVIGAISADGSRERRKRAAIGAGIGALTGAGVGHYMDQQEAKLRTELAGTGVGVTRMGNDIVLNMPGNVTFASNRAEISANFYPVLDSVARVLDEYGKTLVEIVGHTDSTGSDAINQPLSERRASSVSAYLRSRRVVAARIETLGAGSRYPVASNTNTHGRASNRRVEIALLPLTR